MNKATDKLQLISDKIEALLNQELIPWRKDWVVGAKPQNLITGHIYKGQNPIYCAVDMMYAQYELPYFATFHQIQEMGWNIIKNSKVTWILWGGCYKKEEENEVGEIETKFYRNAKWHSVFNVSCIDDSKSEKKVSEFIKPIEKVNLEERLKNAQYFIDQQKAKIIHKQVDKAFYSPDKDTIQIPNYELFMDAAGYAATVIHELGHWTGHKNRLNRPLNNKFGSKGYAAEELVAELCAAMCCHELGINYNIEFHASYIQGWLEVVKADKEAFFKANRQAQKAASLLLKNAGIIEENPETIAA